MIQADYIFRGLSFTHPWAAALLAAPLLLLLWRRRAAGARAALVFSNIRLLGRRGSFRLSTRWLPAAFLLAAWLSLSLAMMGPRKGREEMMVTTEGIAIAMVMDASGSMAKKDMADGDRLQSRLEMVQAVFRDFVRGNPKLGLSGRENDLVGLVVFDRFVEELCPLTLDHDFLMNLMQDRVATTLAETERLERMGDPRVMQNASVNGTAAYEGVAMAAELLKQSEKSLAASARKGEGNYTIKSKVMIVLTDGQDNASQISPADAAKVAREFGVKVYTIAVHGRPVRQDIFGLMLQGVEDFDDKPMQLIAKETGGQSYKATNPESLSRIYEEIGKLETSRFHRQASMEYEPRHEPFILAGLALLLLGLALGNSYYRELP